MLLNKKSFCVAIDATGLAPGGGLVVAIRLWEYWCKLNFIELHVWYSRIDVANEIKQRALPIVLHPFRVGQPVWQVFLARQLVLGREMIKVGPDVVMGTNIMVRNISCPQLVHQQNLLHFVRNYMQLFQVLLKGDIQSFVKDLICRETVKKASGNVYISEYMRRSALSIVSNTIGIQEVIYNPIVLNEPNSSIMNNMWSGSPVLLAVSNDSPHKDYTSLFRILGILKRLRPETPWKLKIAGQGVWKKYNETLKNEGVENSVEFLGFCDCLQMAHEYRNSFCLIYYSRMEGFGLPPLEAMSYGCPVITSDCTAIPEVTGDAAVLIDPENYKGFADAVIDFWDHPELRIKHAERGKKWVVRYSADFIANDMLCLLKKLSLQ